MDGWGLTIGPPALKSSDSPWDPPLVFMLKSLSYWVWVVGLVLSHEHTDIKKLNADSHHHPRWKCFNARKSQNLNQQKHRIQFKVIIIPCFISDIEREASQYYFSALVTVYWKTQIMSFHTPWPWQHSNTVEPRVSNLIHSQRLFEKWFAWKWNLFSHEK